MVRSQWQLTEQKAIQDAIRQSARLNEQARFEESAELCRRALERAPGRADLLNNLGVALAGLGRWREAAAAFEQALAAKGDFGPALNNLAAVLIKLGEPERAAGMLAKTLGGRPAQAEPHTNLATLLRRAGHWSEARRHLEAALRADPRCAEAWEGMAVLLRDAGDAEGAVACFRRALELKPNSVRAASGLLLTLNYLADADPLEVYAEHRAWARRFADPLAPRAPRYPNERSRDRPLHIGYLSPDFRRHPVMSFLEPVLEAHDRDRFRITCYASVLHPDDVTARLKALGHGWRDIAGFTDEEAAGLIRSDQVDILVDLSGHTQDHRLLVMARRPAPVQVTWLGYPNTTGLKTIDYRFTDELADPTAATDPLHSERLWRLPGGFSCWRPPRAAPKPGPLPALERGWVTFGSFNYAAKMTLRVVETWAEILRRVPGSRLVLKYTGLDDPGVREQMRARFARWGVAEDRVEMLGLALGGAEHYRNYQRLDIALDPFPYNGTTTTCDALWMGVPVVTLAGRTHAARVGVTLLAQVGLEELVAADVQEYVRIAVALAGDLERLGRLRSELRGRVARSPLTDGAGFARRLEQAYCEMWRRWLETGG